jgi:hypothetical protein
MITYSDYSASIVHLRLGSQALITMDLPMATGSKFEGNIRKYQETSGNIRKYQEISTGINV